MSLEAHVDTVETVSLSGAPATFKKITTHTLFVLINAYNRICVEMGIDPKAENTGSFGADDIKRLISQAFASCELDESEKPVGAAKIIIDTLSRLFGVTFEQAWEADIDDLYLAVERLWEVNASGPLGQRVRRIIAKLMPSVNLIKDLALNSLQLAAIKGLPYGGTVAGGMMPFSPPSMTDSTGPSDMFSTNSPPSASSESLPASDTLTDTEPPSSEAPKAA